MCVVSYFVQRWFIHAVCYRCTYTCGACIHVIVQMAFVSRRPLIGDSGCNEWIGEVAHMYIGNIVDNLSRVGGESVTSKRASSTSAIWPFDKRYYYRRASLREDRPHMLRNVQQRGAGCCASRRGARGVQGRRRTHPQRRHGASPSLIAAIFERVRRTPSAPGNYITPRPMPQRRSLSHCFHCFASRSLWLPDRWMKRSFNSILFKTWMSVFVTIGMRSSFRRYRSRGGGHVASINAGRCGQTMSCMR